MSVCLLLKFILHVAAAKSLQLCPTLCDPTDGSLPGSPVPGILQARKLEWVAISFSNVWKWKVTVKSLSHVWLLATPWTAAYQIPPSMGFSRQEYWSGVPSPYELPYDPAIPVLGIHTQETRIERDTCTPMFIAALFIIARTWKQPRCPSADEWIRKHWYIYTMEYYSAIKKNTFESVLMRWMKLEPIIQSEVSQKEKHQYNILTHIYGI